MRGGARFAGLVALAGVLLAGCGAARQDADAPHGTFPVQVDASFPARQAVARPTTLRIKVRNAGRKTIPDVAVTVRGFDFRAKRPGLADPDRPLWIIDKGPYDGDTAYVDTWTGGSVPPGATHTFTWHLIPVVAGRHDVRFEIAPALEAADAHARTPSGGVPRGRLSVRVSGTPDQANVDPNTGKVIRSTG